MTLTTPHSSPFSVLLSSPAHPSSTTTPTPTTPARHHDYDHDSSQTEKGTDAQKRLVKDFYETVEDYDP